MKHKVEKCLKCQIIKPVGVFKNGICQKCENLIKDENAKKVMIYHDKMVLYNIYDKYMNESYCLFYNFKLFQSIISDGQKRIVILEYE